MKTVFRWLSILPAVLFFFLILHFSAQTGTESGSLSFALCQSILTFFDHIFSLDLPVWKINSYATSIHLLIRKAAHITEYFILTFCVFLPLKVWFFKTASPNPMKELIYKTVLPSFLICLCCASGDEFLQSFVPGRCGTPVDVLIDSIGIALACLLLVFYHYKKRTKSDKH